VNLSRFPSRKRSLPAVAAAFQKLVAFSLAK